ncbi:MAG: D-alanyl-D-alanine carboxypeptidase family protein [Thiobacillus sp.]
MKKLFWVAGVWLLASVAWAQPKGITARAWIVTDVASGKVLAEHKANVALAPASLTQMMVAYVLFGDLKKNKLSLGELLSVPESATRSDGARVFLKAGEQVSVDTLMQALLVHSATDATLTLAEGADGSEAAFVARMNREAVRLGMTQTRFMNAVGLTEPGQRSSAQDLAVLARALLREFPERQAFFQQKELQFHGDTYYNRNRLLWRDATVDGLKSGRTTEAGYCVAASARRGDQRRIAIVLGAGSDGARTENALRLLNYGFENFDSVKLYRANQPVKQLPLYRGARDTVSLGFLQDFHLLPPRGSAARLKADMITQRPIVAPIRRGQQLGSLRLTLDGKPFGEYPLVALHDVGVAGILGRGWDSIRLFFGQ